jgi:hypothetical protein
MRFAREHGARPGVARVSDGSVFFYTDHYRGTDRWLVNRCGDVLDVATFPSGAVARAEEGEPAVARKADTDRS